MQKTKASGKRESLGPCRSWIEQQRFAEPFRFGLMRMTKDADIGLFAFKKCETFFCQLPAVTGVMTLLDDGKSPVIQGMENVIRSFKASKPRIERAVRIGVIADTDFMLLAHHPLAKHTHLFGRHERHRFAQRGPMALNNHS